MDVTRPPFFHDHCDLFFEHVSADGASIDASFDRFTRTGVTVAEVEEILGRFAETQVRAEVTVEPQISVRASGGRFNVRADRGRLLACDVQDPDRTWLEMSPQEILRAATAPAQRAPRTESMIDAVQEPLQRPRTRAWVFLVLAVGLGLNLFVVFRVVTFQPEQDFVPVGDGQPTEEMFDRVNGAYAVAAEDSYLSYERIKLERPNFVTFQRGGPGPGENRATDLYLIGTYKGQARLLTGQNGFIDAPAVGKLVYRGEAFARSDEKFGATALENQD